MQPQMWTHATCLPYHKRLTSESHCISTADLCAQDLCVGVAFLALELLVQLILAPLTVCHWLATVGDAVPDWGLDFLHVSCTGETMSKSSELRKVQRAAVWQRMAEETAARTQNASAAPTSVTCREVLATALC